MERRNHHRSADERRAAVTRIVAESEGRAPRGVALIGFRAPTKDELAYAETLREPARKALARNAARDGAAAA